MSHPRTQIRAAVVALLTGLPITGANVFASRVRPFHDSELPALNVLTGGSNEQQLNLAGSGASQLDLTLTVEIRVKQADGVDDAIDDIAEEVELAMQTAPASTWLGGFVESVASEPEFDEETNLPTGICRLAFSITTFV